MLEVAAGVSDGPDDSSDLRSAGAAERAGGKGAPGSAESTRKRLSFRVVPSIPTPEPPVPPLAAHFLVVSPQLSVLSKDRRTKEGVTGGIRAQWL